MNWLDVYREIYIGITGLMIGVFLMTGYLRLHQKERWARGLFFVTLALIGFMLLSIMQFAGNLGNPQGWQMFLYPGPLFFLGIGTYLISTSEIRARDEG